MGLIDFSGFKYYLPLTYPWQIRHLIPARTKTIVDVGCGDGYFMNWVSFGKSYQITGIDVNSGALERARRSKVYKKLVKMDLTKRKMPAIKSEVVICSQVVEHLKKSQAMILIKQVEKLASERIIIATTNGFIEYDHGSLKSSFDKHQSGWEVKDFTKRGYKVLGHGLKWIYRPNGIKQVLPSFVVSMLFFVSYLITPILMYFPKQALFLIAYKDLDEK